MNKSQYTALAVLGVIASMAACSSEAPASVTVASAVEATAGLVFSSDFDRIVNSNVVTDKAGNSNGLVSANLDGSLLGASWTTRVNGGDALDITGGHVTVAATPALNSIREGVTVCARVRARSTSPGWGGIVTRQEMSQDVPGADFRETYGLYVNQNTARFVTNVPEILTLNTPVPLDEWVQLCATYDSTTKRAVGYMNCVEDGTANLQGTLNNQTNNPLIIGGNHNFGVDNPVDENFPGSIDDVRVYNRALSAAEVGEFCAPTPLCAPGAIAAACCRAPGVDLCQTGLVCDGATDRCVVAPPPDAPAPASASASASVHAGCSGRGTVRLLSRPERPSGQHVRCSRVGRRCGRAERHQRAGCRCNALPHEPHRRARHRSALHHA